VKFTEAEARAIAARLGVSLSEFRAAYTHDTPAGRSLAERKTEHGYDCVFLDRETVPGKAICSIYEDRPMQCRTWPWWPQNLGSRHAWKQAARSCEGIGRGAVVPIEQIRIQRDRTPSD
jgi:Fe-S-cluster containining protein